MDPDFADDDGLGKMRFPSRGYATKHGMAAPETLMAGITSSGMIDEKKAGAPAMVHVAPYLVEFIGTFFLVHVISLLGPTVVGPLAVGAILMAMVGEAPDTAPPALAYPDVIDAGVYGWPHLWGRVQPGCHAGSCPAR